MIFRLAEEKDLPTLKAMYKKIVEDMKKKDVDIWDEIYPSEFLKDDIARQDLYVLTDDNTIAAALALCVGNLGESFLKWENQTAKAVYIDRLGVNVDYAGKGVGSLLLRYAAQIAKEKRFDYLRLFVVDINMPAIKLYEKYGFKRAEGIYEDNIFEDEILYEYGFEIKV